MLSLDEKLIKNTLASVKFYKGDISKTFRHPGVHPISALPHPSLPYFSKHVNPKDYKP